MEILFYISLAVIIYTYIGYPFVLTVLSVFMHKPVKKADIYPVVTVFISAYNEAKNIEARISNLLESDYPREKMEIIVGSDGSTDETYQIIKRLAEENKIRYAVSFQRIGKPAMLNKMAKDARGEIFIFTDSRQAFERNAIRELIKCFADIEVGCVSGELIIRDRQTGAGAGIGLYWEYEKTLRKMESAIGSMLGATGAIYAIRQQLFRYLPNVLLDDIYVPMEAIMLKKRAIFEPAARAYDVVSETTQKEFMRKVRTLVGNFQIFRLFPEAFNPWKSKIAFQLFSHKFLRLMVPYFLLLAFLANFYLIGKWYVYSLAFFLQLIFYGLASFGYLLEKSHAKMEPHGFTAVVPEKPAAASRRRGPPSTCCSDISPECTSLHSSTGLHPWFSARRRIKGLSRLLFIPYEFYVLNLAAVVALGVSLSGGMDVKWKK